MQELEQITPGDTKTGAKIIPSQCIKKEGMNGLIFVLEPRKMTDNAMHSAARFYTIINESRTPESRGGHQHPFKSEMLFLLRGTALFKLRKGDVSEEISLTNPHNTILIPPGIWHEVIVGADSILGVLSPCEYHPKESVI